MTQSKKDPARQIFVNWQGLKTFLGWTGTVEELKRVRLDLPAPVTPKGDK
jgi:hypothetical protein